MQGVWIPIPRAAAEVAANHPPGVGPHPVLWLWIRASAGRPPAGMLCDPATLIMIMELTFGRVTPAGSQTTRQVGLQLASLSPKIR